jgi:hypothetical protein
MLKKILMSLSYRNTYLTYRTPYIHTFQQQPNPVGLQAAKGLTEKVGGQSRL